MCLQHSRAGDVVDRVADDDDVTAGKPFSGQPESPFDGHGREVIAVEPVIGECPERKVVVNSGQFELVPAGGFEISGKEAEQKVASCRKVPEQFPNPAEKGDV